MTTRYPFRDKLVEVRREILRREKKYPHLINAGVVKDAQATRSFDILRSVERDYEAAVEHEQTDVES